MMEMIAVARENRPAIPRTLENQPNAIGDRDQEPQEHRIGRKRDRALVMDIDRQQAEHHRKRIASCIAKKQAPGNIEAENDGQRHQHHSENGHPFGRRDDHEKDTPDDREPEDESVLAIRHIDRILKSEETDERQGRADEGSEIGRSFEECEAEREQSEIGRGQNGRQQESPGKDQTEMGIDMSAIVDGADEQRAGTRCQNGEAALLKRRRIIGNREQGRNHDGDAAEQRRRPLVPLSAIGAIGMIHQPEDVGERRGSKTKYERESQGDEACSQHRFPDHEMVPTSEIT